MSDCPRALYYTESHEWLRLESDDTVVVGITDYAQHQLGDLVFIEFPDLELEVEKSNEIAVVESVKTAADVYAPLDGKIIEVNQQLVEQPELVNQDPYGLGWLYQMKISHPKDVDDLMDADAYEKFIADSGE